MPNFAVNGRSPSLISQTGTQEALVRNTGDKPVFLDAYSSVSSANYGLELQPFDSVNWAQGRDLWAVCAPGDTSTLSVLYGAEGVSLGAVSAVVTGDVTATIDGPVDANILGTVSVDVQNAVINADVTGNIVVDSGTVNVGGILTPVSIEGGGEAILTQSGNIAAGAFLNIPVPTPPSGRTYYAFKIKLSITNAQHATLNRVLSYTDTFDNFSTIVRSSVLDQNLSIPYIHSFTVPAQESTMTIQLANASGALVTGYSIEVRGVNVGQPTPTTNLGYLLNSSSVLTMTPPTVAPAVNFWIPASFQDYNLLLRTNSTTGVVASMALEYMNSAGTLETFTTRAYNAPGYPDVAQLTNSATSVASRSIPISGNGRAARIQFPVAAGNSGSVAVALIS